MQMFLSILLPVLTRYASAAATTRYLQLTAVVSGDNGVARFECWQMATPFSTYPTVGETVPGLATVTNVSYVALPPRSKEGLHNPPWPMFFVLLSGLAHVTLPESDDQLWILEGVNGLIIAADVEGDGHYTEYPSDKPSVALQIPFENGKMPEHRVLKHGVCDADANGMDMERDQDDQQVLQ